MKTVLVLGAGRVARPLVQYLLDKKLARLTVADQVLAQAASAVADNPLGRAITLDAADHSAVERAVADHDLTVSLLPAPLHPVVAEMCVRHRRHLVTASYISPAMRNLDAAARSAGVLLLNEIGLDPGIDHMSAMRIIHAVQHRGGHVISFRSYCGGLPAPEACDNPWGYKFSWSPRGVCTAGKNAARWLEGGCVREIPGPELFANHHRVPVDGVPGHAALEGYPNRDSLSYIAVYGLRNMDTMFRGTLRYPGWCACMKKVVDFGLLDETPVTYAPGTTFAAWTAGFLKPPGAQSLARHLDSTDLQHAVRDQLGLPHDSDVLRRWQWLGLFSQEPIPITGRPTTALDILATRMEQKMCYAPHERDMVVLLHEFIAEFPSSAKRERIRSTLVDFGIPHGDSSMSRTVGLPAAIAVRGILTGQIADIGVHAPVQAQIYAPILNELESLGIACREHTETI